MLALFFEGLDDRPSEPLAEAEPSGIATDMQLQLEATELELRHTRENLQTTIEELEAANEELQSTNEELMASNEELQSTNEELQSVNEELHSVNSEHQDKLKELRELTDDLDGILSSIDPGIVVVSRDLRLRRFNEAASRTFNIIAQDVGRPLAHITHKLGVEDLAALCERVSQRGQPVVQRVRVQGGRWARLAVTPRLAGSDVDGVVVVVTDVTGLFEAERQAKTIAAALEHAEVPLCVLSTDGKIVEANTSFGRVMGRDFRWIIGTDFRDLSITAEEESLSFGLGAALRGRRWSSVVRSQRPDGTQFWESLDLIPLPAEHDAIPGVLRMSTILEDLPLADLPAELPTTDAAAFFLWELDSGNVKGRPLLGPLFGLSTWSGGTAPELFRYVPDDDQRALETRIITARSDGHAFAAELQLNAPAGARRLALKAQPILHPPHGRPLLVVRCQPAEP